MEPDVATYLEIIWTPADTLENQSLQPLDHPPHVDSRSSFLALRVVSRPYHSGLLATLCLTQIDQETINLMLPQLGLGKSQLIKPKSNCISINLDTKDESHSM